MKGYWEEKYINPNETGRLYTRGFVCRICGYMTTEKHNFCPNCGDDKRDKTKKLISAEKLTMLIRHMMDIDGFRDGDTVSRKAVIALIGSMQDERESDETG